MALVLSGSIDISGSMTATTIIVSAPGAAGMVSSSNQLVELNTATGSIKGEIAGIEAYTASLKGAIEVSGQNVNILGTLTAQEIYTTYVTSSVMFKSGSTKFGDDTGDAHEFTGSLNVSGGLLVNGTSAVTITANTAGNNTLNLVSTNSANSGKIQFGGATYGATIEKNSLGADNGLVFNSYHGGAEGYTFQSNGTNVMKLTSAGRLGLEVPNPDVNAKLHIADTANGYVGIRLSGSGNFTGTDWTLYASSDSAPSANDFFGIYNNSTTDSATSDYKVKVYKDGNVNITNGNLVIGTSGKGIDFSATSNGSGTTSSELLNDYEEGTWTPTLGGGSSDPTGVTYDGQTGNYTKVGRLVTINFIMGFTTYTGGTGAVFVRGLPFACAGGNAANGAGQLEQFSFTGGRTYATLRVNSGDSVIDPQQMGASTSWTAFTHGTNITSSGTGKYITGTVTYTT